MKPSRTPRCEHGNRHTKHDDGELHIVPGRMMPANPVMCVECPLRRDSKPGYLGGYSPEMYIRMMASGASVACHMTPGFQAGDITTQRHCTGVAAWRANTGHITMVDGVITLAHESTRFVATVPGLVDKAFASADEFVAHHAPGQDSNKE